VPATRFETVERWRAALVRLLQSVCEIARFDHLAYRANQLAFSEVVEGHVKPACLISVFRKYMIISCSFRPLIRRGASRSSRVLERDAVDAQAGSDKCSSTRTAKPCGPDVQPLFSACRKRRKRWKIKAFPEF
jgi:hypothetical protein